MIIWSEGFEVATGQGQTPRVLSKLSTFGGLTASPRGGFMWSPNTGESFSIPYLATDQHAKIIVGLALKPLTLTTGGVLTVAILQATGRLFRLMCLGASDGMYLALRRDSTTAADIIATPHGTIDGSALYYVELLVDTATGSAEIRILGHSWATVAGHSDILGGGLQTSLAIGGQGGVGQWSANNIDDLVILNGASGPGGTGFLGDVHIELLPPTGNGAHSDWVGSDGDSTDNYALVNDESFATLVTDPADNAEDTYAMRDLAVSTRPIIAVVQWMQASTNLVPRKVAAVARLSSTEQQGTDHVLTTSRVWYRDVWDTKPGGAGWLGSDVNSAEFGFVAHPGP